MKQWTIEALQKVSAIAQRKYDEAHAQETQILKYRNISDWYVRVYEGTKPLEEEIMDCDRALLEEIDLRAVVVAIHFDNGKRWPARPEEVDTMYEWLKQLREGEYTIEAREQAFKRGEY